jgi:DNA-binding winged helix-turn-helix (wHTH) protein
MKLRIDEWEVDTERGFLTGPVGERRPEPTVLRLLEALAREPGQIVSRARLVEQVWDGRHVSQGALTVAICGLRKALGDDSRRPRFVRTHPGRGYSLLATPVRLPTPDATSAASEARLAEPVRPAGSARWVGIAVLLAALWTVLGLAVLHPH